MGTGNPSGCARPRRGRTVYPRGHGESRRIGVVDPEIHGLSPWARGIPNRPPPRTLIIGSIPVGTGNPIHHGGRPNPAVVYPRGHGESYPPGSVARRARGLSPWARGIRSPASTARIPPRSIPVGTGNPRSKAQRRNQGRVYPRGHGESLTDSSTGRAPGGLSPWARGIRR